jgi:hypothetical protein
MNLMQGKMVLSRVSKQREDIYELNRGSSDISSMSTLTLDHGDETKIEWDPQTRQRAEGLESLLEIYSDLRNF